MKKDASDSLRLPKRTAKPRRNGITAITDLGTPLQSLRELVSEIHPYLDIAKFGVGAAYLTPRIAEKVAVYQEFGVIPYFGGTLFEKFYHQRKIKAYAKYLKGLNVDWIEISNGTVDMPLAERVKIVKQLSGDFRVLAEVGCKDADKIMPPSQWIDELQSLLAAGASYVITEGRDSATAGIYRSSGELREGLLTDILHSLDPRKVIFEAPTPRTQMYFINLLGANVNLGNVALKDVLLLEAQRCGLRYETFFNQTA